MSLTRYSVRGSTNYTLKIRAKLEITASFQEVLDIARLLLVELGQHNDCEIEEKKSKLEQLKTVLEM